MKEVAIENVGYVSLEDVVKTRINNDWNLEAAIPMADVMGAMIKLIWTRDIQEPVALDKCQCMFIGSTKCYVCGKEIAQ